MILIVPCFNEHNRIDSDEWIKQSEIFETILFVNDGSTDNTSKSLKHISEKSKRENIDILELATNSGKAEAIRQGVLYCKENYTKTGLAGYCDADLSTPASEMHRLSLLCSENSTDFLMGSRIKLAGYEVERSGLRHYLGRLSATLISNLLNITVYDTQAGAKVFKLKHAEVLFSKPFISSWLFDCELILRAQSDNMSIAEEPLKKWIHHASDSKINFSSYTRSLKDLIKIRQHYKP